MTSSSKINSPTFKRKIARISVKCPNYVSLTSSSEEQPNERTPSLPPRKKSLSPPQAPSKSISSKSTHHTSSSSLTLPMDPPNTLDGSRVWEIPPPTDPPNTLDGYTERIQGMGDPMTGNLLEGGSEEDDGTTPTTKEYTKRFLSALRSLVKEHNSRGNVSSIRLNFDEDKDGTRIRTSVMREGSSRRLLEESLQRNGEDPINTKDYRFMRISSFMDAHKCLELAKRYSDKVPKMLDEMMVRLDDFVRSEEAVANTELPKGEVSEALKKLAGPVSKRGVRFHRGGYGADR
nr:reverse transcriptase domain-containing protein [Tanacetum cinerariifolium]